MPKPRSGAGSPRETITQSVIGHGMKIVGDCTSTDSIRIEGAVEGKVQADKAVVVGKSGEVTGDIDTQDAVIAGTVTGAVRARSRLELSSTGKIDGEIQATLLQLDEGGTVNGTVSVGRAHEAGTGGSRAGGSSGGASASGAKKGQSPGRQAAGGTDDSAGSSRGLFGSRDNRGKKKK